MCVMNILYMYNVCIIYAILYIRMMVKKHFLGLAATRGIPNVLASRMENL